MNVLEVETLSKRFGSIHALDGVDFGVAEGEFFCIVGPTNAGKTTLLHTVAGLHRPNAGRVRIRGNDVTRLEPRDRHVSLQFQNVALFPAKTGFENIAFPLRNAGVGEPEIRRRVEEVSEILGIGHILGRYPRTFSGGEQQRVAIGRAIVHPANLLMLDEPLTNLDARIRIGLRLEFKKLHRDTRQTMLYVTHDQVEAMSLSDRIAVLHQGRLEQIGTPDEIYHRPVNRFVATFIGMPPMNILEADLETADGGTVLRGDEFTLPVSGLDQLEARGRLPRRVGVGARPEDFSVDTQQTDATPLRGDITWIEHLGSKSILDVRLGRNVVKIVVSPQHPANRRGEVWFGFTPKPQYLLDLESDQFLR